jgi:hypothetical protein
MQQNYDYPAGDAGRRVPLERAFVVTGLFGGGEVRYRVGPLEVGRRECLGWFGP